MSVVLKPVWYARDNGQRLVKKMSPDGTDIHVPGGLVLRPIKRRKRKVK